MLVTLCAPACTCRYALPRKEELQQSPGVGLLWGFAKSCVILQPSLALTALGLRQTVSSGFPTRSVACVELGAMCASAGLLAVPVGLAAPR